MNKRLTVLVAGGLATLVMIEIYTAASGALLAMLVRERLKHEHRGLAEVQNVLTLRMSRKEGDDEIPRNELPTIGVAVEVGGEVVTVWRHMDSGRASAVHIVEPKPAKTDYIVFLPRDLRGGDRILVHLHELRPESRRRCEIEWSLTGPSEGRQILLGEKEPIELSDGRPAWVLDLDGFSKPGTWEGEWYPAN